MNPAGSAAAATVVIVTYNSASHIAACLDALIADPARPEAAIVIDNNSADATVSIVERYAERLDWLRLISNGTNVGFGAGCHRGVAEATTDAVAFLNPDAIVEPGWLPPLLSALEDGGTGAAMATVAQSAPPGTFDTSGGALTYTGLGWATDTGRPIPAGENVVPVRYPSGAAMAMRRAVWDEVGGFRPGFFLYHEDSDLGWRLHLAGYASVRVPASRVVHDRDFGRNPFKFQHLERNRYFMLATNYRHSTLVLIAPALLLTEIGTIVAAIRDGWFREKVQAWREVAQRRSWLSAQYALIQTGRVVGDADVLGWLERSTATMTGVDRPIGSGIADAFLSGYLRLVLPIVRSLDRRSASR